jgi:hypothetical protein
MLKGLPATEPGVVIDGGVFMLNTGMDGQATAASGRAVIQKAVRTALRLDDPHEMPGGYTMSETWQCRLAKYYWQRLVNEHEEHPEFHLPKVLPSKLEDGRSSGYGFHHYQT